MCELAVVLVTAAVMRVCCLYISRIHFMTDSEFKAIYNVHNEDIGEAACCKRSL